MIRWVIKSGYWYRAYEIGKQKLSCNCVWTSSIKRAIKYKTKEKALKNWPHEKNIIKIKRKK